MFMIFNIEGRSNTFGTCRYYCFLWDQPHLHTVWGSGIFTPLKWLIVLQIVIYNVFHVILSHFRGVQILVGRGENSAAPPCRIATPPAFLKFLYCSPSVVLFPNAAAGSSGFFCSLIRKCKPCLSAIFFYAIIES